MFNLPLKTNILSKVSEIQSKAGSAISKVSSSLPSSPNSGKPLGSKITIPRQGWVLYPALNPSEKIIFNVNPSSIDYTFNARKSSSKSRFGRIFTQGFSNKLSSNMDIDVTFQMQSGNLLNPDKLGDKVAGHSVFFTLLKFMSDDVIKDGKLNYLKLEINTVLMGTITLLGFIDPTMSVSETADNPFSVAYPITFNVFSTEPTVTDFSQILLAMTNNPSENEGDYCMNSMDLGPDSQTA